MTPAKYKNLRGAVESFTEGFTSVLWTIGDLAEFGIQNGISEFAIDFLNRTITPPPSGKSLEHFLDFRNLPEWFDSVGCSFSRIRTMEMHICFDFKSREQSKYETSKEDNMRFTATTDIVDDRGKIYSCRHESVCFFFRRAATSNGNEDMSDV